MRLLPSPHHVAVNQPITPAGFGNKTHPADDPCVGNMIANAHRPRMLIIDDEPGIRLLLARIFGRSYHVVCAGSVDEGMRQLTFAEPDVILMDIDMPGKNGLQGLQEIRVIDPFVRIIIMTGSVLPTDCDTIIDQGAAWTAPPSFGRIGEYQNILVTQAHNIIR